MDQRIKDKMQKDVEDRKEERGDTFMDIRGRAEKRQKQLVQEKPYL